MIAEMFDAMGVYPRIDIGQCIDWKEHIGQHDDDKLFHRSIPIRQDLKHFNGKDMVIIIIQIMRGKI